jgi:Ribosomal protein L10
MPSNKVLEEKKAFVAELADQFKNAAGGVLVKYQGITVDADTKLRASLRAAGVTYMVAKNTLMGRAFDEVGMSEIKTHLEGMNAVAISEKDPIAVAKVLTEYAEKIPTFEIKAGFLDGGVIDAKTVDELAKIPPKEVLLGRLLGSIQTPLYGLAISLQAVVDKSGEAPAADAAPAVEEAAAEAPAAE